MKESLYHSNLNAESAIYGKHEDYDLLKDATLNQCAHYLLEGRLKHDRWWCHWHPQISWVVDAKGKIRANYIGRVETLEEDLSRIAEKLGRQNCSKVKRRNISASGGDYRAAFDAETRDIVARYYAEDIDAFGYTFSK